MDVSHVAEATYFSKMALGLLRMLRIGREVCVSWSKLNEGQVSEQPGGRGPEAQGHL